MSASHATGRREGAHGAEAQVKYWPHARYKGFRTEAEARQFVHDELIVKTELSVQRSPVRHSPAVDETFD